MDLETNLQKDLDSIQLRVTELIEGDCEAIDYLQPLITGHKQTKMRVNANMKSLRKQLSIAQFRAEKDPPVILKELQKLERIVGNLMSAECEEVLTPSRKHMFTYPAG